MFHGTRQILGQLVFMVKTQQSLALKYKLLHTENRMVMNFLGQYIRQQKQHAEYVLLEEGRVYSSINVHSSQGLSMPNTFETAESLSKDGVLFRTEQEGYTRCSSFCTYVDSTHACENIYGA